MHKKQKESPIADFLFVFWGYRTSRIDLKKHLSLFKARKQGTTLDVKQVFRWEVWITSE